MEIIYLLNFCIILFNSQQNLDGEKLKINVGREREREREREGGEL